MNHNSILIRSEGGTNDYKLSSYINWALLLTSSLPPSPLPLPTHTSTNKKQKRGINKQIISQ